jgi:hypothetical protein
MSDLADGSHGIPNTLPKILVTGDVVTDHYIYEGTQTRPGSKIRLDTIAKETSGGAALLDELLREISSQSPGRFSVACGFDVKKIADSAAAGYCVMRPFEKQPKGKVKVWRMAEALGFGAGANKLDLSAIDSEELKKDHLITVLDDAGLLFRLWPAQTAWPRFLVDSTRKLPEWLVIKMSGPVASSDLWHTLASGQTQDNQPQCVRDSADLRNRTIAVISINDLRVEPILVSKNLSWERAALDLVEELRVNPRLAGLRELRFVIVSLDTDGALIAEFPRDGAPRFRLVFDPGRLEGDFDAGLEGSLFGYQTCLTAAVVSQLVTISSSSADAIESIEQGVRTGLCTMRRLLVDGHGPAADTSGSPIPGFPILVLATEIVSEKHDWSYGCVEIPSGRLRSDPWTIIAGGSATGTTVPLWGLARRVALHGVSKLQETPYLQFGKLFSVERTEIESLRTLQRLMISYRDDPKAEKPLSIAAFGPPGSGKSFGVKQLAKAIFADDTPPLEFNLSQFEDASELRGLFHQVRDEVLRGRLPVVFWDEFDSQNLKWLQYLLAPMQDGTFQEGQITHPIGKCVFVFAGGTRWRFEDFGEPPADLVKAIADAKCTGAATLEKLEARREDLLADFVVKKAPDFKSRLAGYINVLGPNPRDLDDITFPVRRALLLRVHLGVDADKSPTIDPGLLAAFLEIKKYRHGARSLEKIAEQVRLASRTGEFTRSDLPARSQLELHVDAEQFLTLVERET